MFPNGLVYFIQICGNGPIKIGVSDNPDRRLRTLQLSCPYDLQILFAIPGGSVLERQLLQEFSSWRIRGEWFWPVKPLLDRIAVLETLEGSRGFWVPDRALSHKLALIRRQQRPISI